MMKRLSIADRRLLEQVVSEILGKPVILELAIRSGDGSIKSTKLAIDTQNLISKRKELVQKSSSPGSDKTRSGNTISDNEPPLNPTYRFGSFVVGDNSLMAHAASLAVSQRPGEVYNPLFLYGGVGLGKTHLLHAIGHKSVENFPEKTIRVCSAETYTNELIDAIGDKESLRKFRSRYRHCDVLLIDDIHFLIDKEATQEAFFHTFNILYDMHKQIVITSDRHPRELRTLKERLINRFQLGLIVDIQKPSYETRLAILKRKAQSMGIEVPQTVLETYAEVVQGSIRSLEGCLKATSNLSNSLGHEITLDEARQIAESYSHERDLQRQPITLRAILDLVCHHYRVSLEELQSASRESHVAHPRHVGMYLARKHTSHSLKEIARAFHRKDHATVFHGVKKIEDNMNMDAVLAREVSYVEDLLLGKSPLK
jgi:chromosomal replication initiator protein